MRKVATALLMWLAVGGAAGSGIAGCAGSRQYFEPTERIQGETLEGHKQALYSLAGPDGVFGEAHVWSRGAYYSAEKRTVIQVAFALHNLSAVPMMLDARELHIESVLTRGGTLPAMEPADPSQIHIAAQSRGEAQFHFVVQSGVEPGDIRAFKLQWAVHGSKDAVYKQETVFIEPRARPSDPSWYGSAWSYPCWPYGVYDCFYGRPYYWGAYGGYPPGYWPPPPPPPSDRLRVHPNR